jgi:hypothetical protein
MRTPESHSLLVICSWTHLLSSRGNLPCIQQPHESTESGTCPWSYSPQGHQTCRVHFGRAVHEQACCLQVFLNSICLNHLNKNECVKTHSF